MAPNYINPEVRKEILIEYMKMKIAEEDWHAVADAAMDLREIAVQAKLLYKS